MVYSLNYRRPAHVSTSSFSGLSEDEKRSSLKSGHSSSSSIPDALSFDRIIQGGTCPPCTVRDFMNYLVYIEHSAENLQFYLWWVDYVQRFASLKESEAVLSQPWTPGQAEAAEARWASEKGQTDGIDLFASTAFGKEPVVTVSEVASTPGEEYRRDPFGTPSNAASEADDDISHVGRSSGPYDSSYVSSRRDHPRVAEVAYTAADVRLKPFTVQPFREEISRVITNYIMAGAPRELNLSSKEKRAVLHALAVTTHPSAFAKMINTIEYTLRYQAHPNFIRWTICNGNRPRVIFARGLGIFGIMAGVIVGVVLTLGRSGRGWRALSAIGFFIGISTLIAAWKGMCVVLHGMHHRHLRPWELFVGEDSASSDIEMKKASFDTIGSSNSYEDEPWIAKYEKRNLIRKIFDREIWIQEPALRQIQDTIFIQSLLGALIISAVAAGVFVALPSGNYY